jgi:hypothetical protein
VRHVVVSVVMAALTSGCVMADRYRHVQAQPDCFKPSSDPVPGQPNEHRPFPSLDCRSALYKVAFVEFDEDGNLFDPAQAKKALALIDAEKARVAGGKIITLLYVHGWKNNANQMPAGHKPKDVERFGTAMAELGYQASQASPASPVPIVGVYIGWKGKSLMGPGFFTFLSYWSRRNTANRVGAQPLMTLINDVIDHSVTSATDRTRVMLVGHSFGARVLEHAVESGVKLWDPEVKATGTPVRPRVDLVLYVNAATDSRLSVARLESLRRDPITVRHPDYDPAKCAAAKPKDPLCREYPLLVAITSKGDQATKYAQPAANTLNFDGNGAPMPPLPTGTFLDPLPSAGKIKRSAPGHFPFLHSHAATEIACPLVLTDPFAPPVCDDTDPFCAFAFRSRGECTACFRVSARQPVDGKAPFNQTAYWIMNMDARVIKDHGDIWNLSTLSMLGAMMAPRGFFDPLSGRMQIR